MRIAKLCVLASVDEVAGECDVDAETVGITANLGDDGFLAIEHVPEYAAGGARPRTALATLAITLLLHAEISSGTECARLTGKDGHANVVVVIDIVPDPLEFGMHLAGDGVATRGVIQSEGRNAILARHLDHLILIRVN